MSASATSTSPRSAFFTVLRYRDFRLFWSGLVAQITGQQMMMVTLGVLALDLTGSPLTLGIINLVGAIPRIVLTLIGGALADRWDQRRLIGLAQGSSAAILAVVAVLTMNDLIQVWHLAAASFLIGLVQSFDEPSRQALFPKLLPHRSLIPAAVPLMSLAWSGTRIIAPAIAGLVIFWAGAGVSFLLSATGAAIMVAVIRMLRTGPIARERSSNMLRNVVDGARYAWGHMVFRVVIGMAFVNAFFGMSYTLMLPVFQGVLSVDSRGLGFMYSAAAIGSIAGLITYHRLSRAIPPGWYMLTGVTGFSVFLIAFALNPWFPLSLVLLFLVGYTHTAHQTSAQVLLQTLVPDHLRGRVMGLHGMLWSLMPLGGALLNSTAEFTGAPIALAGGASFVLAFVLLVCLPNAALRNVRLEAPHDPGSWTGPPQKVPLVDTPNRG